MLGASASGIGVSAQSGSASSPALQATNTSTGPAASFNVTSGQPFTVNSTTKVANLNADQVDGIDGQNLVQGMAALPGAGIPAGKAFFSREHEYGRSADQRTLLHVPGLFDVHTSCLSGDSASISIAGLSTFDLSYWLNKTGGLTSVDDEHLYPSPPDSLIFYAFHQERSIIRILGGVGENTDPSQTQFELDLYVSNDYQGNPSECFFMATGMLQTT